MAPSGRRHEKLQLLETTLFLFSFSRRHWAGEPGLALSWQAGRSWIRQPTTRGPSQLRRPPRRATAKAQRGVPAEGSLGLDLMPTETLGQNDQQELPHQRVCCPPLCAMPV